MSQKKPSQKKPTLKLKSNKKKRTYKFSPIGNNNSKKLNNNNKTIFDFGKYIAKNDIDDTYDDIIPENDSIVYFLILSHGAVRFNTNYIPYYVDVPHKIDYFNKITYAPVGFSNYETNDPKMLESIKTKIKVLNGHENNPIVANKLIESLRQVDCVLEDQTKNMNETPYLNDRCGQKMLVDRSDLLYESVVHSKTIKNNSQIMNKTFSTDKNDDGETMNIYVVFANGGLLKTGDKVLNSKDYINYLSITIEDKKELLEAQSRSSTKDLLDFAEFCDYKNVVMIDYSCNTCIDDNGERVPRNLVIQERKKKQFAGRGIHKKLKKTKKHISRKLKQNRKSKKYKKM